MSPLLNAWKTWEKAPENAKPIFQQVSEIFQKLRKSSESSEIFGKFGIFRKVLKTTFQQLNFFLNFLNLSEIRKSTDVSEIFEKNSEFVAKCLKRPSSLFQCF